jgi:hypothetical protein
MSSASLRLALVPLLMLLLIYWQMRRDEAFVSLWLPFT